MLFQTNFPIGAVLLATPLNAKSIADFIALFIYKLLIVELF
jgi:hypothetical protein